MPYSLTSLGRADLIPLLGELLPADKMRVPVQAADFMAWHIQRLQAKTMTAKDYGRAILEKDPDVA